MIRRSRVMCLCLGVVIGGVALATSGLAATAGQGAADTTASASAGQADGHARHEHATAGFTAGALIEPMGIATLVLVAVTVGLGIFRKRNPKLLLTWHKRVGPLALAVGAIHAALVMLSH